MNATLLENTDRSTCHSRREVELSASVEKLLSEVAQLRREVTELRQQVGYWKSLHDRAVRKNEKLQQRVDELVAENRQLKDRLFGSKSEKGKRKDRSNQLADPEQLSGKPKRQRGHQPDQAGPGRRDYSHLPVVEQFVELSTEEQICPKCGRPREEMTETEDSEVVEIDVRAYRRRIRRKRYRCTCNCTDVPYTITAPSVPKLISKGRYGISV